MLTAEAPAKVNLVLEVVDKFDTGYHRVQSIVHAIDLCDVINFEEGVGISFECNEPVMQQGNLVVEAALLLKKLAGISCGVNIKLHKRIPWGMGLGGGSSDAAATLFVLNRIWKLELSLSDLAELAGKLGADVPFFIYGGTALVEGRGEKVQVLPGLSPSWFVLLFPALAVMPAKTERMYHKLDATYFTRGEFVQRALSCLAHGEVPDQSLMFNVFEKVAMEVFPVLAEYAAEFKKAGAPNVQLVGSGPALFSLVCHKEQADNICRRLQESNLRSCVVSSYRQNDGY